MVQYLRVFLLILGAALVVYGAYMLFYFGTLVQQIIAQPEQVNLVSYIIKNINATGPAMLIKTPEGQQMYFEFSETVKTIVFLFMGIAGLGVLAGIVRALIWGGVQIIKVTLAPWNSADDS